MNFKNQITTIAILAGSMSPAFAETARVEIGDVFPIPKLHAVKIVEAVANADRNFEAGDQCGVRVGANATVVQEDQAKALLRYNVEGNQRGNKCPDGTLFALDSALVQKFPQYVRENEARDGRLKARVLSTLEALETGELPKKTVLGLNTGDSLHVTESRQVHLARPAQNEDTEFDFGESCAVDERASVTLLDFDNSETKALVANDTAQIQRGNSCPRGSLFVMDVKQLVAMERGWAASVEDTRVAVQKSERPGAMEKAKAVLHKAAKGASELGEFIVEKGSEAGVKIAAGSKVVATEIGHKAVQAKDLYFQKSEECGTALGNKGVEAKDSYFEKSEKYGTKVGEAYFRASQAAPKVVKQTKEEIKDGYRHVRDWISRVTHWNH